MRTILLLLIGLLISLTTFSQGSSDLRIEQINSTDSVTCYEIQLDYHGDPASLASQNYRIFYDSNILQFSEAQSALKLSEDLYSINIVQQMEDLNASGVGPLSFENNLGFLNIAIILNDNRRGGQSLAEENPWLSILSLCFDKKDAEAQPSVVLARKDLTSSYGRAYVELSQLTVDGVISTLPINSYSDYQN